MLVTLEIVGRRMGESDIYDFLSASVLFLLGALTLTRHRQSPLGWMSGLEGLFRRLRAFFQTRALDIGVDLRGTPPLPAECRRVLPGSLTASSRDPGYFPPFRLAAVWPALGRRAGFLFGLSRYPDGLVGGAVDLHSGRLRYSNGDHPRQLRQPLLGRR